MPERLSPQDITRAAMAYGLDPAALRAVIHVESSGAGFLPDGRPRILFERHILWRRLQARGLDPNPLAKARPDLCGPRWERKYYRGNSWEWARVADVIRFGDRVNRSESYAKAAYEACSWGLMQLMGMNFEAAGFANVLQFKTAHELSEESQLRAALEWMTKTGILPYLQKRDWVGFTYRYNGPGQVPIYFARLALAYRKARKA